MRLLYKAERHATVLKKRLVLLTVEAELYFKTSETVTRRLRHETSYQQKFDKKIQRMQDFSCIWGNIKLLLLEKRHEEVWITRDIERRRTPLQDTMEYSCRYRSMCPNGTRFLFVNGTKSNKRNSYRPGCSVSHSLQLKVSSTVRIMQLCWHGSYLHNECRFMVFSSTQARRKNEKKLRRFTTSARIRNQRKSSC